MIILVESTANDITLPVLNFSNKDDVNETLEMVKLKSRSVLRKAGFHSIIKQRVKVPEARMRRMEFKKRKSRFSDEEASMPKNTLNLVEKLPDINRPSMNASKHFDSTAHTREKELDDVSYPQQLSNERNLNVLKYESQNLLKDVKKEMKEQEEELFEDTPLFNQNYKKENEADLRLDNSMKEKMMKSVFTNPYENDLDFESSRSSEDNIPNRLNIKSDISIGSQKRISNMFVSGSKRFGENKQNQYKATYVEENKGQQHSFSKEPAVRLHNDSSNNIFKLAYILIL